MISHLAPVLKVSDIESNISFFKLLGFKCAFKWGNPPDYAVLKIGEANIHLSKSEKEEESPNRTDVYLFVKDIEAF